MSKEFAIILIVVIFVVIPLTLAMPVFLYELHDWMVRRELKRELKKLAAERK